MTWLYIPPRPKAPEPVDCDTCGDWQTVSRIRGGLTFSQPCPNCIEEDPTWSAWHEADEEGRQER